MKILSNALKNAPDEFLFELIKIQDNVIVKIHYKLAACLIGIMVILSFMYIQYYNPIYVFNISMAWLYTIVLTIAVVFLRYTWIDYLFNRAMRKGLNNEVYGLQN
jgi:hypothetical protein